MNLSDAPFSLPAPEREIFCNRTLNLRSIQAIGYDMDYTLIHYREEEWEQRAYEHLRNKFAARGWPVGGLRFDPEMMERGLVLNIDLGDILEANRFGYVKQACHGTRLLDLQAQRQIYARTIIDLSEERFVFLNTLFSLSEGCMFAQLVDLLDQRQIPEVMGYRDLYHAVKRSLDQAHMEGQLKAEIMASPSRFVELDPETPLALLDQRHAGKKLLLITNSEWSYTRSMMAHAFDSYLPDGMTWRQLFDVVIVSARKPDFFSSRSPLFEVVEDQELLRPVVGGPREGGIYFGGNASRVEEQLGLSGDQILYVGDHVFGDVHVTKSVLRWRTALIVRELEHEIRATEAFADEQRQLSALMAEKDRLELRYCHVRLEQQRARYGYGPSPRQSPEVRQRQLRELRSEIEALDARIGPLAKASAEVAHRWWGPMMRAGNDKSILARQVERYADIYTSRVSNFLHRSPYAYLRSPRGSLPHDPVPRRP
jgi:HAD superfamily 5'-nucleotidase-like hydrolase